MEADAATQSTAERSRPGQGSDERLGVSEWRAAHYLRKNLQRGHALRGMP